MNDSEILSKNIFFVYTFADPKDGVIFYCGKGYGSRIAQHFAKSRLIRDTPFYARLREILFRGDFPVIVKVCEDMSEEMSITLEKSLIEKHKETILNQNSGGGRKNSKLNYIPAKNLNIAQIQQLSLQTIEHLKLREISMMTFNRQSTLRIINENPEITAAYLELTNGGLNVEEAIEDIYYEFIHDNSAFKAKWDTFDNSTEPMIIKDGPIMADIRKLVEQYGWKDFIVSLADFAQSQKRKNQLLGMSKRSEEWRNIFDKVKGIRKTVQL